MTIVHELFAVVGPTGTGKSELAMALCESVGGEILSCDSAQVFRGLDVGTAKPTKAEQTRVPHHLIDVIEADEQWSAAQYTRAADEVVAQMRKKRRVPIVCGGTGLWLRALVHGLFEAPQIEEEIRRLVREELEARGPVAMHGELAKVDPDAAARIKAQDPQRIGRALEVYRQTGTPISVLQAAHGFQEARYRLIAIALRWPRDVLADRLRTRAAWMYANGLVEEVEACLERGLDGAAPGLNTIGYREVVMMLEGKLSREEAIERTAIASRQYAKRQRNWFNGVQEVQWLDPGIGPEQAWQGLQERRRRGATASVS